MKTLIIIIVTLLSGCTMKAGEQTEDSKKRTTACTDTRDGEVFTFKNNTVKDARQGYGAPTCFTITTLKGADKRLCSDMEVYLKCHNI